MACALLSGYRLRPFFLTKGIERMPVAKREILQEWGCIFYELESIISKAGEILELGQKNFSMSAHPCTIFGQVPPLPGSLMKNLPW